MTPAASYFFKKYSGRELCDAHRLSVYSVQTSGPFKIIGLQGDGFLLPHKERENGVPGPNP